MYDKKIWIRKYSSRSLFTLFKFSNIEGPITYMDRVGAVKGYWLHGLGTPDEHFQASIRYDHKNSLRSQIQGLKSNLN